MGRFTLRLCKFVSSKLDPLHCTPCLQAGLRKFTRNKPQHKLRRTAGRQSFHSSVRRAASHALGTVPSQFAAALLPLAARLALALGLAPFRRLDAFSAGRLS